MSWILSHSYDKLGKGKGEFEYARGIIVSEKTGNITVADISNKRIQVLAPNYEQLCEWDIEVYPACKLCPLDVHRVSDSILAAIIEGHAVIYQCPDEPDLSQSDVKLLSTFGNKDFVFPRAVVTMNDQFIISDVGKHRITMHNENGAIIRSFGSLGVDDATNFNWPYYMCTDDKGRLAVSDSHNKCIKLFDKNLNYIGKFGNEVLTCCAGVACAKSNGGKFYVVEYDNKSMFEFAADGRLIQCIDEQMSYPGQGIDLLRGKKLFCSMHHGFFVYKFTN